jgi:DNA-binding transcriptional LysR family regulator
VELDWLETFLAVVDHGGFTAASDRVHRSQSRVSAHIAALERELGVRLVDRHRRPATPTAAGAVFAAHARDVVAGIGSARSAIGALRALDAAALTVLTTPCIGAAVFPRVLAEVLGEHPGARLTVCERGAPDVEQRFQADGVVVAVLPALDQPLAPGMRERLLWREPIRLVVPHGHALATRDAPVGVDALVGEPLVVVAGPDGTEPEVLARLAVAGVPARPRVLAGSPHTLAAMVRAGLGVGALNAVAAAQIDTAGLAVLDLDDPDLLREVGVYWYDVLLTAQVGKALHRAVLAAPLPPGAVAPGLPVDGPSQGVPQR